MINSATMQSNLAPAAHGLLRGACHRAALRADPLVRNDARDPNEICRHHRRVHRHRLGDGELLLERGYRVFGSVLRLTPTA